MLEQNGILKTGHSVEETVRRYDEIAEEYSSDWRGKLDATELIRPTKFEELVGLPPRKILDAGCGTGKHCIHFAERGYNVYGIDRSLGMLGKAVENSTDLKVSFATGDMRSLSFPNNFFDGVWTVAAIAHLVPGDKRRFIQEAYRVLRHNGILYIGTHNLSSVRRLTCLSQFYLSYLTHSDDRFVTKIKMIIGWARVGYVFLDNRHWFYPKKSSLLKMLRETGFSILESNSRFSKRLSIYARKPR